MKTFGRSRRAVHGVPKVALTPALGSPTGKRDWDVHTDFSPERISKRILSAFWSDGTICSEHRVEVEYARLNRYQNDTSLILYTTIAIVRYVMHDEHVLPRYLLST